MLGAFWVDKFCRVKSVPKVFPKRFHLKNPLALWSLLGKKDYLLGGLEHLDYFSIYWERHHPNRRFVHHFSEG